ncbi:hypothetical protein BDP27DRAFT_1393054 [Rhodocollybia butyracea]|uniref:DUF6593 domain-containing protein n=1 Tax=Rhodocollybia butyracea TaxID=206335 RepID=A0A9P5PPU2_9AGAR|nr:hypothetical protein BDP27DRAFT_1393054 [Rhodocollybia butyracea]
MTLSYEDTPLTLIFTPDDPCSTTIIDAEDGALFYRVVTEGKTQKSSTAVTKVLSATGEAIASWRWKKFRPDRLTLGKAAPISMSAWLKKSIIAFNDTATFSDPTNGNEFQWKGHTLHSKDDKSHPIAIFSQTQRIPRSRLTLEEIETGPHYTPAKLVIFDARGEEALDFVLVSLLVLERQRRTMGNSTKNHTDALAVAHSLG